MALSFQQTSSGTRCIGLESEPEAKLHLPGVIALAVYDPKRRPRPHCRIDAQAGLRVSREWIREDGVVEHVGDDIFEPQADLFCDMNIFHHSHVHVPVHQSAEHAKATRVAVETQNRRTKGAQQGVRIGKDVELSRTSRVERS